MSNKIRYWFWGNESDDKWAPSDSSDYFDGAPDIEKIRADDNAALNIEWEEFKTPYGDHIIIDSWGDQVYVWGPRIKSADDAKHVVREWLIANVGKTQPFGAEDEDQLEELLDRMFDEGWLEKRADEREKVKSRKDSVMGYTPKDWKMAEDHLKTWSLEELREWGREAGFFADKMDKDDLIEVFLEHNGQPLIDELKKDAKKAKPKKKVKADKPGYDPADTIISPELRKKLDELNVGDVDLDDKDVLKVMREYETDILNADINELASVLGGHFYGRPPSKWYDLYMDLAKIVGWDTDFAGASVTAASKGWRTDSKGVKYKTYRDKGEARYPDLEGYVTKKGGSYNWLIRDQGKDKKKGTADSLESAMEATDKAAKKIMGSVANLEKVLSQSGIKVINGMVAVADLDEVIRITTKHLEK